MQGQTDTYTLKKTINYENMVIRVYSPVLTEDERKRRYKQIHNAAANLLKGYNKK